LNVHFDSSADISDVGTVFGETSYFSPPQLVLENWLQKTTVVVIWKRRFLKRSLFPPVFRCSVPLKAWKCGFDDFGTDSASDCVREIAVVFAESRFFCQLHAYVSSQREISAVKNSVLDTCAYNNRQLSLSVNNIVTAVSSPSETRGSECAPAHNGLQNCTHAITSSSSSSYAEHPYSDLPFADIPGYVDNEVLVLSDISELVVIENNTADAVKQRSRPRKTGRKSSAAARRVGRRRVSRKAKAVPSGGAEMIGAGTCLCIFYIFVRWPASMAICLGGQVLSLGLSVSDL